MTSREFIVKIHTFIRQNNLEPLATITLTKHNRGWQEEDDWVNILILPSAQSMQKNDPKCFVFSEDEIGYIYPINPDNWMGRVIKSSSPPKDLMEFDSVEKWDPCETSSIRTISAIRNSIVQDSLSIYLEIMSQQTPREAAY